MLENQIFPSEYFRADDFINGDRTLTIKKYEMRKLNGESQNKLVLFFDKEEKKLVVNKTNYRTIKNVTGESNTDNWGGKKIILGREEDVPYMGDIGPALRVRHTKVDDNLPY